MSRVEEIELAIQELSAEEFARIAQRVHELEQERWDEEMDRDASAGKLDFLIEEAEEDRLRGRLKDAAAIPSSQTSGTPARDKSRRPA
jgi:hypothetical protein